MMKRVVRLGIWVTGQLELVRGKDWGTYRLVQAGERGEKGWSGFALAVNVVEDEDELPLAFQKPMELDDECADALAAPVTGSVCIP